MIYFDCPRGASGDMLLGALLDINKDKDNLKMALVRAGFKNLKIDLRDKKIDGISGTAIKFITGREPLPNYGSVKDLLENIKTAKTIKNNIEKTYDII
ncbi:MAG: DUF111 family protein, partial [Elusimicrobia bacterium]|nr:DUF111 family protein [Elusimicrobiota bacterium]